MKIELSNKDAFLKNVLKYLGYPTDIFPDNNITEKIWQATDEVEKNSTFQSTYAHFDTILDFLKEESTYREYLSHATEYLLCAYTLGAQIDRKIKRLQITDMTYSLVFDAVASAYLECSADEFEKALPYNELGFRFCPGYGGTSIHDNQKIASLLHAERIGISFLESGLMVPLKSMIGIIRVGGTATKTCRNCVVASDCPFRAKGTFCYAR